MTGRKIEVKDLYKVTRMHHLAIAKVICIVMYWVGLRRRKKVNHVLTLEGERVRNLLFDRVVTHYLGRNIIRLGAEAFVGLCDILVRYGGLRPSIYVSVEEQVAKTLYVLSHNVTNRAIAFFFYRSGESNSRHFHNVLRAVLEVENRFLIQPNGYEVPPEIRDSSRYYPFFKDCVGAIDGTHIAVKVSPTEAPKYRGRKDKPTLNVLAACSFDLKFTYVLAGWEGTASDSRIIKDALSREYPLKVPEGKYYLVDAGFMLKSCLITPYRGQRYHLKEYSRRNAPRNARELFNHRHSALRNAIERAFGVLKKVFPIIANEKTHYGVETQKAIILACFILHNYKMDVDPDPDLLAEVDRELANENPPQQHHCSIEDEDSAMGEMIRDSIAASMWADYNM